MSKIVLLILVCMMLAFRSYAGGATEFEVLIESNVVGARVYVDDTYFGKTPVAHKVAFPASTRASTGATRELQLRLEAEGYEPSLATITVRQEYYSTQRFFVEMIADGTVPVGQPKEAPATVAQSSDGVAARALPRTAEGGGRDRVPVVSVLDFKVQNVSTSEASLVVDLLSSALFRTRRFRVIEQEQRRKILEEIEFSRSDCVDERCQLEIGKLLSADSIVVGTIGVVAKRYVFNVKLLDVETGETMNTAYKIYGDMGALVDGCEEIAFQLSEY